MFTSVNLAIQYIGDVTTSFRIGRWLLGGLEVVGFQPVVHVLPFAAISEAVAPRVEDKTRPPAGGRSRRGERGRAVIQA